MRLTSVEMDEKCRRGICFGATKNSHGGHKCGTKQLHMLTIDLIEDTLEEGAIQDDTTEEGG